MRELTVALVAVALLTSPVAAAEPQKAEQQPQGAAVQFSQGRVEAIFTLWAPRGWRTASGLKIGDPSSKISRLYGPLSRTSCGQYSALVLPMRGGVNVFYVSNRRLWGFGLLNFLVQPCR